MFKFSNVKPPVKVNKDFVLSQVQESMLWNYYYGNYKIGEVYPSKFRKDRKPSTGFYISKSQHIILNDFTNNEKLDIFSFIMKIYGLTFDEAVKRVASDFGLVSGVRSTEAEKAMTRLISAEELEKKDTKIAFIPDAWGPTNLKYWNLRHLDQHELKGIYTIKKLFINEKFIPVPDNCIRYALTIEHEGDLLTKVYSPEGGDFLKWVSNIPLDMPFGLEDIRTGLSRNAISKAQKDRLILKKFLPSVIASQNESPASLTPALVKQMCFYYPENWLLWDNDAPGIKAMERTTELYPGLSAAWVPENEQGLKDWDDVAVYCGLQEVERLLKEGGLID